MIAEPRLFPSRDRPHQGMVHDGDHRLLVEPLDPPEGQLHDQVDVLDAGRALHDLQARDADDGLQVLKGVGLRVRSSALTKLSFYRDEDFNRRGCLQDVYLPNTQGQWRTVVAAFEGDGLTYVHATPLSGPARP